MEEKTSENESGTGVGISKKCSIKIVLLGESGVGKSSIAHRFVNNKFCEYYEATIGAGYFEKNVVTEQAAMKLCIWDTAGQERFASLASFYYRGAQGAIVVFDVSKKATFERAREWVNELNSNAPASVIISLVGNKTDLPQREVTSEEALSYAKKLGLLYMEVSAKNNEKIEELFFNLIKHTPLEEIVSVAEPAVQLKTSEVEPNPTGSKFCSC